MRVRRLSRPPRFVSWASVGGYEESRGPLGEKLDFVDKTDTFGQKTWELAEGEMGRCALNMALTKAGLSHDRLELLVAGDLQNQCVASSLGAGSFGIPFLGVYGACSTCTESLLILSVMLSEGCATLGAAATTSHNSAAERQFRTPVEYGAQRAPSAQWTATAGGAFILSSDYGIISCERKGSVELSEVAVGKIIDGATADGSNMGGAMAFAAADTILSYFEETGNDPAMFDHIVTGDLGRVGSDILRHILGEKLPKAVSRHTDCGLLLYDSEIQDVHSGASGCGTSASVLAAHFLPALERGDLSDILFLSTGALMSPSSVLQGRNISAVAPLIRLTHRDNEKTEREEPSNE
ncbi:MAG: stage V sporulation protein AD [Clostridia bacterium]|nr:stage V sporulation protein AD [Clostridia bacterium]